MDATPFTDVIVEVISAGLRNKVTSPDIQWSHESQANISEPNLLLASQTHGRRQDSVSKVMVNI